MRPLVTAIATVTLRAQMGCRHIAMIMVTLHIVMVRRHTLMIMATQRFLMAHHVIQIATETLPVIDTVRLNSNALC